MEPAMHWTNLRRAVLAAALCLGPLAAQGHGQAQAQAQTTPPAAPAPAQGQPAPTTPAPATPPSPPSVPAPEEPQEALVTPVEVPERSAIILRGTSKWDDGFASITGAFSKLRAEVDKQKLTANGKPLAVFVQSDDEGFTFEAMMPVDIDPAKPPALSEGIKAGRSPGGSALKFEHRGAYEDIESTYEAIAAYLDEKGLAARDELIEEFVKETPNSDDTELSVDIYVLLKQ